MHVIWLLKFTIVCIYFTVDFIRKLKYVDWLVSNKIKSLKLLIIRQRKGIAPLVNLFKFI